LHQEAVLIRLFYGFDPREEIGAHTFVSSVIHHASQPVALCPLHLPMLPMYSGGERDGTNAFIYSRFLIPQLCGYEGWAIFVDGADMIVKGDIAELWSLRDEAKAVQVVKHDYKTKHPRKYVGTPMEADNGDYPCKNWSSVMLINCGHDDWQRITPRAVAKMTGAELHRFQFIRPGAVGALPVEWNHLADELGENPRAKLLHWTAGIPAWPAYRNAPHADDWRAAHERVNHAV
jgi:hypothetical protein